MNERISWTLVLYHIIAHLWWIVYVNIKLCDISKYSKVSYSYTVFGCIWCISNSSKLRVGVQVPTKTAGMTEDRHGYQSWAQPIGLAIHEDFCGKRFTPQKLTMEPENHLFFKGKTYSKSPIFWIPWEIFGEASDFFREVLLHRDHHIPIGQESSGVDDVLFLREILTARHFLKPFFGVGIVFQISTF